MNLARCLASRALGGAPAAPTRDEARRFASMWRSGWFYQHTLADMFGVSEATLRDYIHWVENRGRWATDRPMNK